MLNHLKEKKEYVILNFIIWACIKNENLVEKKIEYKANNNQLIIHLNDAETVYFHYNSSIIINESSYIGYKNSNKEKIEKTFDCIRKYFIFKQSLIKELNEEKSISKNGMASSQIDFERDQNGKQVNMLQSMPNIKIKNQNEIKEGFLIKKEIFKEWEKYTDYENIKNKNILSKNQEEIEEIKENINKNFIVNKPLLDNIKTKKFKDIQDISNYLNNHLSLILVNVEFFDLVNFKNKNDLEKVEYSKIQKNFINLNLSDKKYKSEFVVYSYNNIISPNIEINLSMVNNLIELYTFQESLKLKLKQNKKEKIKMKLVNREWISNIKNNYNYNTLCDSIKNSKIIKDKINNFESINGSDKFYCLNEISKNLLENFLDDLLYKIYLREENNRKKYELSYKKDKIEYKGRIKEIKYINNFEFIDSKLFHQIMENNINNNENKEEISKDVICHIFDGKILIIYENKYNYNLYISGYINIENLFISEYYFDYLNIDSLVKKDSSDIFQILKNNPNRNYFGLTGIDNQSVVHCYKLKSDKSQNINISYLEKREEEVKNNYSLKEKEIEKNCKKAIEALIELYLMNKELKIQLMESLFFINFKLKYFL